MKRGFVLPIPAIIIAVVAVIAVVATLYATPLEEPESGVVPVEEAALTERQGAVPEEKPSAQSDSTKPKPSSPSVPPAGTPPATPKTSETPSGSGTPPSSQESSPPAPSESSETTPPPAAWSPGFKAGVRVTPEIPSENERATLPACDGKVLSPDPVNLGVVSSIRATGKTSASAGAPSDFVVMSVPGGSNVSHESIVAPGDVYITHIAQEFDVTRDPDDTTIYFALCRDVVGYITNIKELSDDMYKIITDSTCLGKPHVGENACHIEVLKLISSGSFLGSVGEIEGTFGFGVIDLRAPRALANPAQYSIKTNFAACPLSYLLNPAGFFAKLKASSGLCTKP